MAERVVSFKIEGSADPAIQQINNLLKKLDEVGAHQGFKHLATLSASLGDVTRHANEMAKGFKAAQSAATMMRTSMDKIASISRTTAATIGAQRREAEKVTSSMARQAQATTRVFNESRKALQAQERFNQALHKGKGHVGEMATSFQRLHATVRPLVRSVSLMSESLGRQARFMSVNLRAGLASAAQSFQSFGIGLRMSGLALGQQFASLGTQGPLGTFASLAGIGTVATTVAARAITTITGAGIKIAGAVANALVSALGSALGFPAFFLPASKILKSLGAGFFGAAQAVGNLIQGLSTALGELVLQVGNVFTGMVEAARGAFQAVVQVGGQLMQELFGIVNKVVGQISGVLGTIGKTIFGVGATLTGFALKDVIEVEHAVGRAEVLLPKALTSNQRRDLESWINDLSRQFPLQARQQIGEGLLTAVSTGFQENLPGARKVTEQAARLSQALGEQVVGETVRVFAKSYSLFGDELAAGGRDPFETLAESMFALVNYADLRLPDIADRLGDILAAGKLAGVSFQEMLTVLAQMSISLGKEEAFTDLRRLLIDFKNLTADAKEILKARGIESKIFTDDERKALDMAKERIKATETYIEQMEQARDNLQDQRSLQAEFIASEKERISLAKLVLTEEARRTKDPAAKEAIQRQVFQLRLEEQALGRPAVVERDARAMTRNLEEQRAKVRKLREEYETLERQLGRFKHPFRFLEEIGAAGLSDEELTKIFPNIRSMTGALIYFFQDPTLKRSIERGMADVGGQLEKAVDRMNQKLSVSFGRLWEGLKRPFTDTLLLLRPQMNSFLASMTSRLDAFAAWWRRALIAPEAFVFIDSLKRKLSSLLPDLDLGRFAKSPGEFWRSLTVGLDKAWQLAGKAVTAIKTLAGVVGDLIAKLKVGETVWGVLEGPIKLVSTITGELTQGRTKTLDDTTRAVVDSFQGLFDSLAGAVEKGIKAAWGGVKVTFKTLEEILLEVGRVFSSVGRAISVLLPTLGAGLLGYAMGGRAPPGAPGALPGAPGGGGGPGFIPIFGGRGGVPGAPGGAAGIPPAWAARMPGVQEYGPYTTGAAKPTRLPRMAFGDYGVIPIPPHSPVIPSAQFRRSRPPLALAPIPQVIVPPGPQAAPPLVFDMGALGRHPRRGAGLSYRSPIQPTDAYSRYLMATQGWQGPTGWPVGPQTAGRGGIIPPGVHPAPGGQSFILTQDYWDEMIARQTAGLETARAPIIPPIYVPTRGERLKAALQRAGGATGAALKGGAGAAWASARGALGKAGRGVMGGLKALKSPAGIGALGMFATQMLPDEGLGGGVKNVANSALTGGFITSLMGLGGWLGVAIGGVTGLADALGLLGESAEKTRKKLEGQERKATAFTQPLFTRISGLSPDEQIEYLKKNVSLTSTRGAAKFISAQTREQIQKLQLQAAFSPFDEALQSLDEGKLKAALSRGYGGTSLVEALEGWAKDTGKAFSDVLADLFAVTSTGSKYGANVPATVGMAANFSSTFRDLHSALLLTDSGVGEVEKTLRAFAGHAKDAADAVKHLREEQERDARIVREGKSADFWGGLLEGFMQQDALGQGIRSSLASVMSMVVDGMIPSQLAMEDLAETIGTLKTPSAQTALQLHSTHRAFAALVKELKPTEGGVYGLMKVLKALQATLNSLATPLTPGQVIQAYSTEEAMKLSGVLPPGFLSLDTPQKSVSQGFGAVLPNLATKPGAYGVKQPGIEELTGMKVFVGKGPTMKSGGRTFTRDPISGMWTGQRGFTMTDMGLGMSAAPGGMIFEGGFGMGLTGSSFKSKIRRAQRDPEFEGGRWKRFLEGQDPQAQAASAVQKARERTEQAATNTQQSAEGVEQLVDTTASAMETTADRIEKSLGRAAEAFEASTARILDSLNKLEKRVTAIEPKKGTSEPVEQ